MTGHWEKVRAGQAGRLIVEEATRAARPRDRHAAAAAAGRRALFGKTLETVLAERPCRVIIQTDPEQQRPETPRQRTPRDVGARRPPRG